MDYIFQLLNKNNFTASLMLTIQKAWWVTHFCTLDWIFQIVKSDIHQVILDMKDPNDSTIKLTMKVFVSYYISWIMNIKRHLKPKLLVHGPHTKTTEMGYKKSTSAQRNNSPCIRQSGNTGASTRAIRVKPNWNESDEESLVVTVQLLHGFRFLSQTSHFLNKHRAKLCTL